MNCKIAPTLGHLREWISSAAEGDVVLVNGCFDILHAGHVDYLEKARTLGDHVVVLLNSDQSVRRLKGPNRPINSQKDRAQVVAALQAVDQVYIFGSLRITRYFNAIRPAVWLKGGDYTLATLDQGEVRAAMAVNCQIKLFPFKKKLSTTSIYEKSKAS